MVYTQEDIIRKVKALLARSRSQNEHEAAVAAAKAQEILQQYNLDLSLLEDAPKPEYVRENITLETMRVWRKRLAHRLAQFNFCKFFFWRGSHNGAFVGEPHNIEVVKALYAYLSHELEQIANIGYATYAADVAHWRRLSPVAWKEAFYTGAVDVIEWRLYEQWLAFQGKDEQSAEAKKAQPTKRQEQSRALVVVKDAELAEAIKVHIGKSKINNLGSDSRSKQKRERHGYNAGVKAGQDIPLNKMIAGK